MRHFMLVLGILVSSACFAQLFPADSSRWVVSYEMSTAPSYNYHVFETYGDTIIYGNTYRKVYKSKRCDEWGYDGDTYSIYEDSIVYFGAMRSLGDRVYYKAQNLASEILMFDHSINIGDTIKYYGFSFLTGDVNDSINALCTNILGTLGDRVYELSAAFGNVDYWKEGVGSLNYFLPKISPIVYRWDLECNGSISSGTCQDPCIPAGGDLAFDEVGDTEYYQCPAYNPRINFTNAGNDSIAFIDFYWTVNYPSWGIGPDYTWTGTLLAGDDVDIELPLGWVTPGYSSISFFAWPNGAWDSDPSNNSSSSGILSQINVNMVDSALDLVEVEISWSGTGTLGAGLTAELGSSVGYNYVYSSNLSAFIDTICMAKGCYQDNSIFIGVPGIGGRTFTFVNLETGDTIVEYSVDSLGYYSFCIDAVMSTGEINESNIAVFPNPSSGTFQLTGIKPNTDWAIRDVDGKLIDTGFWNSSNPKIEGSTLAKGIYILELKSGSQRRIKKLIKY
ncbi:MAG: T9SS type A sorting domain-containing protein [Flavobacteriales bacterium]|nr:T9SS type A sorting domain-containing protein [Flavobacteriales bacterium]